MKNTSSLLSIETSKEQKAVDIGKFMKQALDQGHADLSYYSSLHQYLQGKQEVKKSLEEKNEDPFSSLQLALIDLIEKRSDEAFEVVFKKLPNQGEEGYALQFDADIRGLKKQREQLLKQESVEGWTIVNTDDPFDLFLCGTEVEGSCQHIDKDPKLNKCLLGYVRDGKNRLLAIKDAEGKIKARSVLRLLWDEKEKQSVLFLERIYPALAKEEWKQALEQDALHLSEELKIPLVSQEVGKGASYVNPISSLSSKAPYEYVDASDGVTEGEFVISEAHLIKPRNGS